MRLQAIWNFPDKLYFLGKRENEWVLRTNLGKIEYEGINCGKLCLDEYHVHVGSSVLSGQLCTG